MKNFLSLLLLLLTVNIYSQTWQWAKAENIEGRGYAIATDQQGNVFLTGNTYTNGSIASTTLTAPNNIFVSKYDLNGNALWVKSFSLTSSNIGFSHGAACDNAGNVFITGTFGGTLTIGSTTYTTYIAPNGGVYFDMFIIKFDGSGNLLWSKVIGGNLGNEVGYSAVTDASGNVIIAGAFSASSLSIGSSTLSAGSSFSRFFISKFDANGIGVWASAPALTAGRSEAYNIDMDSNDNFYLCGVYNFSLAAGSTTLSSTSFNDGNYFIAKYDASGVFQWLHGGGGTQNDYAMAVDADPSGNVYLTGGFYTPTLTVGNNTLISAGSVDAFVTKYTATGTILWSKNIGSNGGEVGRAVRSYANGFILAGDVAPFGTCTLVIGTSSIIPQTISTTWIAQFDGQGNPNGFVNWNHGTGGQSSLNFLPLSMVMHSSCNLYIGGGLNYQAVLGSHTINAVGYTSPFVAKFNVTSAPTISATSNSSFYCVGNSVTLTASGANSYSWNTGQQLPIITVTAGVSTNYTVTGTSTLTGCSTNAIVQVSVSTCVGLKTPFDVSEELIIYPNPTNTRFEIKGIENCSIQVFNSIGNLVLTKNNVEENELIDISYLPNGLYFLQLHQAQKEKIIKVIKE